jgi:hypothetical protein
MRFAARSASRLGCLALGFLLPIGCSGDPASTGTEASDAGAKVDAAGIIGPDASAADAEQQPRDAGPDARGAVNGGGDGASADGPDASNAADGGTDARVLCRAQVVRDDAALGELSKCHEVFGDVRLLLSGLGQVVTLPNLERVSGMLWIQGRSVAGFRFPKLREVREGITIGSNAELAEVRFDALEAIRQPTGLALFVSSNPDLKRVLLPKLTSVDADVGFQSNRVLEAIDLPALTRAEGGVRASENGALERFSAPALVEVGASFAIDRAPRLRQIAVPALRTVGEDFTLAGTGEVQQVEAPALERVTKELRIDGANKLGQVHLPQLEAVGTWFVLVATALETAELPKLGTVGGRFLVDAPKIRNVTAPALTEIGGDLYLQSLSEANRVALPRLRRIGENLQIWSAPKLAVLDLASLSELGGFFELSQNPKLPRCVAERIAEQVAPSRRPGAPTLISELRNDCTCTGTRETLRATCPPDGGH